MGNNLEGSLDFDKLKNREDLKCTKKQIVKDEVIKIISSNARIKYSPEKNPAPQWASIHLN